MTSIFRFLRHPLLWIAAALCLLPGCNLSKEENVDRTLSFNRIFDTLSQFDSVTIALKDMQGTTIDVLFIGKVERPADVEKLSAPHWDGGKVIVSITGRKGGKEIYHVDTRFDGAGDKRDSVIVFIFPTTSLSSHVTELLMLEGDSLGLPLVTVSPLDLKDKELVWTSLHPETVVADPRGLKALRAGSADIKFVLKSDTSKSLIIKVKVEEGGKIPDSIGLSPKIAELAVDASPILLSLKVFPTTASNSVLWSSADTLIATVSDRGAVTGLKPGETHIRAYSTLRNTVRDSILAKVSGPIPAQQIAFLNDSTEIFIGGAAESLTVEIKPMKASPAVTFTVSESGKAEITSGKISGLAEGLVYVVATPVSNSAISDTLKVKVTRRQFVESVKVTANALPIYTGGETKTLVAVVLPTGVSQSIRWKSSKPEFASVDGQGKVSPMAPGKAWIVATSAADSLKRDSLEVTVKRDTPIVSVGQDTAVSVGATLAFFPMVAPQEYGEVVSFRWDLDGNGTWDDSASAVKTVIGKFDAEKSVTVRFYVRDSEGNETIATKKVNAVPGPVVLIKSPENNSFSNKANIKIIWTVNEVVQDSLNDVTLKDGANTITRSAKDAAGKVFSNAIAVTLDSTAPEPPKLSGASPTSILPKWSWVSGGGAGSGDFRFKIDGDGNPAISGTETRLLEYALTSSSAGTTYTLYIQEKDAVGNWSTISNLPIVYDLSKPTVTITSPLASGTYITKNATVGMTVTTGGKNAISKVTFSLGGGAPADATPGTTAGTWTIPAAAIPLVNQEILEVTVTAIDVLNNTGSAKLSFLQDNNNPSAPTGLSVAPTPTNVNKASWTWSAGNDGPNGSGLSGKYRYNFGGTIWTTISTPSAANLSLSEGSNTFFVQEEDNAGNWSVSATNTVILDTKAPDAVTFSGTNNAFSTSRTPTWTWTPSVLNGGIASYAATLDGPDGTTDFDVITPTWKPTAKPDGSYTLTIRQRDQITNVLGEPASFTIRIDGTAPTISVSGKANGSTTNLSNGNTAMITGSITDAGGSALSLATWELSGGTTKAAAAVTNPSSFSIATGAMTNHATTTLTLRARDNAGNPVIVYTVNFTVEVAAPTVEWIAGSAEDGTVTGLDFVDVTYSINGGTAVTERISLANPSQIHLFTTNTKTLTATNALNESVSETRTFYRVHLDIRFYSPTGGNGDCKSWKSACKFEQATVLGLENKQLWLLSGSYTQTEEIQLPIGANMVGQLASTSKTKGERSTSPTIISNTGKEMYVHGNLFEYLTFTGANANRGIFTVYYDENDAQAPFLKIENCRFEGVDASSTGNAGIITSYISNLVLNVSATTFHNIAAGSDYGSIYVYGPGSSATFTGCTFSGARPALDVKVNDGRLTFDGCTPNQPNSYPATTCGGTICKTP